MTGRLIAPPTNPQSYEAREPLPLDLPFRTRQRPVRLAAAESLADRAHRRWAVRASVGDTAVAIVAAAAAYGIRFGGEAASMRIGGTSVSYGVVGLILAVLWPVLLAATSAYDQRVAWFGVEEIRRLTRAVVTLLALLGVLHFAFDLDIARGYVGAFVPGVLLGECAWRTTLRRRTAREHRLGVGRHRAVAVGPAGELAAMVQRLQQRPGPIEVAAIVIDDLDHDDPAPPDLAGFRRLPSRDAIAELADGGEQLDLLLRAGPPNADEMWVLARRAHDLECALAIAPSKSDASNVAFSYIPLGATPLLLVDTPALKPPHRVAKWIFDRVGSMAMLVVLSPVLAAIALVILVRDGRPVLFRQERVGRHGVSFRVFKFRTMVRDAEALHHQISELDRSGDPIAKVQDDPRVTTTGRFLRRHSLDELPQLFNVLAGTMSIVGPRPHPTYEAHVFDERASRRLVVKPGLTGLWQVEGRSDLPFDDRVYLDLLYIDHWSPLLDIVIVLRTIRAVLRPNGAY